MLTMFQSAALRAIKAVGGVHNVDDNTSYTGRNGLKYTRQSKWVDVSGARVAIASEKGDGTYGFIGWPTMQELLAEQAIRYDSERKLYVATK